MINNTKTIRRANELIEELIDALSNAKLRAMGGAFFHKLNEHYLDVERIKDLYGNEPDA